VLTLWAGQILAIAFAVMFIAGWMVKKFEEKRN